MILDLEIIKKDGTTHRLSDYGVIVQDFIVSSIPLNPVYSEVEGRNGQIDYGATYGARTIRVPFTAIAKDLHDFPLLRDELFSLIVSHESFYIRELRRPKYQAYKFIEIDQSPQIDETTNDQYVGGKRYLVRISNSFELDQLSVYGEGELTFETTELPFAESIGTSKDIDTNGLLYSQELWSYGMGLLHDEESHKYTHDNRTFRIYNPGIEVHPFEQQLKITISNASKDYQLKNKTTNEIFKVTDDVTGNLILDGANVLNNNLQSLRKTNKQFISIKQGWNEFEQNGTNEVSFDFRFYYL